MFFKNHNMEYTFSDTQKLLIKPLKRIEFVIIFVLATSLSEIVAYIVINQSKFYQLWENNHIQYAIVSGIILGTLRGTFQWLILRQYISDWKWILITVVGTTFISTIQTAVIEWRQSLFALLSFVISLLSMIIYGYLQWYVLRPYIIKARWWIFILPITTVALTIVAIMSFYLSYIAHINLFRVDFYVLSFTVSHSTQALCFCLLQKKYVGDIPVFHSSLALAPDIVNYGQIQKLQQKLYQHISRIWKTDIDQSINSLTYLVGVNQTGDMFAYEPMNQISAENVAQTPLIQLNDPHNNMTLNDNFDSQVSENSAITLSLTKYAKFEVVFIPPGFIKIYSCFGIPLSWLIVIVYVADLAISIFLYPLVKYEIFLPLIMR